MSETTEPTPIQKLTTKKAPMKLSVLTDPNFANSLFEFGALEFKAAQGYWVGKALAKYTSVAKEYDATRLACLKKHAEKKEDGEIDFDDKNAAKFASPEARAAFEAELKELREQEVEVLKISSDVVLKNPDLKIRPNVLSAIDEIFY